MRFDYFLIWGNGFSVVHDILDMIRQNDNFDILYISRYEIKEDMEKFIKKWYSCDIAPWQHLVNKTKYLLNSPKVVMFVLVKNNNPKIILKHRGKPNEHIECERMKEMKAIIRKKYNKPGTEEHVIHGSDFEKQVDHALGLLSLAKKESYLEQPAKNVYPEIRSYKIRDIHGFILKAGIKPIEDTPHWLYLQGSKSQYIQYWETFCGTKLRQDHSPQAFDRLCSRYEYNKMPIVVFETGGKLVLSDGIHRCAIALLKGYKKINGQVLITNKKG